MEMKKMYLKLKEEKGSPVFIFIILLVLMLSVFFCLIETYRIIELHDMVVTEMERAGNIAVEYSMIDEARGYHLSKIDEAAARDEFNKYFTERLELNSSFEKYVDGQRYFKVQFDSFSIDPEAPEMTMKGTLYIDLQLVKNYLTIPIELPFDVITRNVNMED